MAIRCCNQATVWWSVSYVDFPNESNTISDEDVEENSLMNPYLWSIGWYQMDMEDCTFQCETSTQHNSEKAQVLQYRRYDLGGDQDSIRVFNGIENVEFRLSSKYLYSDVEYLKAMKQVRVSQLDYDDKIHVYFAAVAKVIDS